MFLKIHDPQHSHRVIVALCDAEIIGKKFEEGIRQLDCRENFYKDKSVSSEEAVRILNFYKQEDATFNIVGEKSVKAAVAAGLAEEGSVAKIAGIPFFLVF